MASVCEPEVQFAQRLASNEKTLRKKALKKLRSYISARSQSQTGFSEEELLKLWKGLFYCLWMQDKPLLQEELSTQISGLIHHFHSFSAQLLYLQTFLTTMQREWTSIDRLRMDKYFQLVRFMFRQMFQVLQQSQWEPSCVRPFLEVLSSALLQTGVPPVGLQLHVLDLYLRELAVVGAQELTADQNLIFIEPFCKAAAKTKDRSMFRAICSSIFSTIIDQAPFAIQELMDELQEDSDSGQASDDPEEPEIGLKSKRKQNKMEATKGINGQKAHSEGEDEDGDEDDDDGLSDTEQPFEDVGPVLQFDYRAVADKLLQLSSRHNTPSRNRKRLYKIIKVLRDLSQGSFPQDEYPEEVSTDEDDDDFGSRKRMKRKHAEEEEQVPEEKTAKGKAKKKTLPSSSEQNSETVKKQKKKKPQSQTEEADASNTVSTMEPQREVQPLVQPEPSEQSLKPGRTETAPKVSKKKRKRTTKEKERVKEQQNQPTEDNHSSPTEPELNISPPETSTSTTQELSEGPANERNDANMQEEAVSQKTPKKMKKKKASVGSNLTEQGSEHQESSCDMQLGDSVPREEDKTSQKKVPKDTPDNGGQEEKHGHSETPEANVTKAKKKKTTGQKKKTEEGTGTEKEDQRKALDDLTKTEGEEQEKPQDSETPETNVKTAKKQKMTGQKKKTPQPEAQEGTGTERKRKKRKIPVEFEYEADEVQAEQVTPDTPTDCQSPLRSTPLKIQKKQPDFVSFQSSSPPAPLFCRARGPHTPQSTKMKAATPKSDSKKVRFGLKNNQTAEFRKSDRSLLLSPEGTSRVPFDPEQRPKCGVLKSPPTPYLKQKKKKTPALVRTQKKKTGKVQARPTAADFF